MDAKILVEFGTWYVIFLISLSAHEAAHALVAWLGGDDTAYQGGQVTLNPVPHIRREPFGTVLVPILSFAIAGWVMGWASAPYDPRWGRRYPLRHAAMSAAGPCANFLLALLALVAIKILLALNIFVAPSLFPVLDQLAVPSAAFAEAFWASPLAAMLSITLSLNLILFLFNLIPLPPLDGSGILSGLFPASVGRAMEWFQRDPMFAILGLVVAWKLFHFIIAPGFRILGQILY